MAPPTSSPWAPLIAGTAAVIAFIAGTYFESSATITSATPTPDSEWQPPFGSADTSTDPKIIAVRTRAQTVYPSIPSQSLHIATKRLDQGSSPSASGRWAAAIFHTGWNPRLVLQTPPRGSRSAALKALREMLDDRSTGEYEWFELLTTNTSVREFELVRNIKRLACIVYKNHIPAGLSLAVKREHTSDRSNWWVVGLWIKDDTGFVEDFMYIGQIGEFSGNSKEKALVGLRDKLERQSSPCGWRGNQRQNVSADCGR